MTGQGSLSPTWVGRVSDPGKNSLINKANLRDLIAATGLIILLKFYPIIHFSARVTLKFNGWPWKTIGHLFYSTSSFVHHLKPMGEIFVSCDLEIWWMTLKNNRAPLLSDIKLCASFRYHMWIQTGVTVRKRLSWVSTSVTLTFDLWPWPFAWTSLLSLVITPENCMMILWWEHSQKGVTDRRTDGLNHS